MTERGPLSPKLFEEILTLTDASLRGEVREDQKAKLEELLRDPAARDVYLDLVWESNTLDTWARSSGPVQSGPVQSGHVQSGPVQSVDGPQKGSTRGPERASLLGILGRMTHIGGESPLPRGSRARGRRRSSWRGLLGIAVRRAKNKVGDVRFNTALAYIASVLFAAVVAGTAGTLLTKFMQHSPAIQQPQVAQIPAALGRGAGGDGVAAAARPAARPSVPGPAPVARLGREIDCVWSISPRPSREGTGAKAVAPLAGERLIAGRKLAIKSGLAEIVFDSGAETVLEGPATLEICSSASIALERGKCAVTAEKPSARGFEIVAPGMKYTDLGTEFGVLVAESGEQEVHVFRGKVQAEQRQGLRDEGVGIKDGAKGARDSDDRANPSSLTPHPSSLILSAHEALHVAAPEPSGEPAKRIERIERIAADDKQFVRSGQLEQIAAKPPEFRRWKKFSEELCKRSDLVAFYDFQPDENDRTVLRNRAASGKKLDGRIEGAKWADGPMPGKQALEFSGGEDRVRLDIPDRLAAATIVVWLRIDALPNPMNSILMSDRWSEPAGACHLQIASGDGHLQLVCFATKAAPIPPDSRAVIQTPKLAREDYHVWRQLAVVYDARTGTATFYRDGREFGAARITRPVPLVFGPSQVANWEPVATESGAQRVRNLQASIGELYILSRALSADEIKRLYDAAASEPGEQKKGR